jgi:regulator of nonsense transcripts 2
MMSESLESRKFERKQQFDVPLPMRAKVRETQGLSGDANHDQPTSSNSTMAFALLTKKGNRQQVCKSKVFSKVDLTDTHQTRTVELPSDSTFAVAMKNQQQVEKEEQQRIKNLVLNYDLQQSDEPECEYSHLLHTR